MLGIKWSIGVGLNHKRRQNVEPRKRLFWSWKRGGGLKWLQFSRLYMYTGIYIYVAIFGILSARQTINENSFHIMGLSAFHRQSRYRGNCVACVDSVRGSVLLCPLYCNEDPLYLRRYFNFIEGYEFIDTLSYQMQY